MLVICNLIFIIFILQQIIIFCGARENDDKAEKPLNHGNTQEKVKKSHQSADERKKALFSISDAENFVLLLHEGQTGKWTSLEGHDDIAIISPKILSKFSHEFQSVLDELANGVVKIDNLNQNSKRNLVMGSMYLFGAHLLEHLLDYAELDRKVFEDLAKKTKKKGFMAFVYPTQQDDRQKLEGIMDEFEEKADSVFEGNSLAYLGDFMKLIEKLMEKASFMSALNANQMDNLFLEEQRSDELQFNKDKDDFTKTRTTLEQICETLRVMNTAEKTGVRSPEKIANYQFKQLGIFRCADGKKLLAQSDLTMATLAKHGHRQREVLSMLRSHNMLETITKGFNQYGEHWQGFKIAVRWMAKKTLRTDIYVRLKRHLLNPLFIKLGKLSLFWMQRSILDMFLVELGMAIAKQFGQPVEQLAYEQHSVSMLHQMQSFFHQPKLFAERLDAMFNVVNAHLAQMQRTVQDARWKLD